MSVLDKVIAVIRDHLVPSDNIGAERTFQSLGLDDLDILNVVIDLEDDYHIYICEEDIESVRTVADLANVVAKAIDERDSGVTVIDTIVDDMDEGDAK